jgi:dihydroflavonol-4-reductase
MSTSINGTTIPSGTTLVTGATGFLGSHVVAVLRARGVPVRALVRAGTPRAFLEQRGVEIAEGDLGDEKSVRQACRDVASLVHCAAVRSHWSRRNYEQRHVNVEGTARLFRAAHDHHFARIVHVSSISTLGATRDGSLLDESATCNTRYLGLNYVNTKLESEERAKAAAWAGMPVVIVNPSFLVGPRYDGHVPTAVVRVQRGGVRWVLAGGVSVADVEDVAQGIVTALEKGRAGERYVLAGHNIDWREFYVRLSQALNAAGSTRVLSPIVAALLARVTGTLDVVRLSRPPWTPEVFRAAGWFAFADSSKAKRELGYSIRPLEETLRRMSASAGAS